jgi:hypothetical protein
VPEGGGVVVPLGGALPEGAVVPLGSAAPEVPEPIVLPELPVELLVLVLWCFFFFFL